MLPDTVTVTSALRPGAAVQAAAAEGEQPAARTLDGILATYGQTIHPMGPFYAVRLADGALEVPEQLSHVKLLAGHMTHPLRDVVGVLDSTSTEGSSVLGSFRFGSTQAATEAHAQARDGILDGLSVGFRVLDGREVTENGEELYEVTRAELFEVSLVPWPADSTARVQAVTATQRGPAPVNPPPVPAPAPEFQLSTEQLAAVAAAVAERLPAPVVNPFPDRPVATIHANERFDTRFPGAIGRDGKRYTAGDYVAAMSAANKPGATTAEVTRFHEVRAALADELTSDVPGLLPTAIVGELLGRASGRRPVWDSFSPRDMPMLGEKFSRPKISQHVKVDVQDTQKTEVASQKYKVGLADVPKVTLAGALDVARQAIDWTSPTLLNELIIDFTRIYLARTDTKAATDLVAAATGTGGGTAVSWDGTATTLNTALATAAGTVIAGASAEMDAEPNTIWLSVDMWVRLAGLSDSTGRPLLPAIGPSNASGQINLSDPNAGVSGMGFRWVLGRKLPPGTMIMGDRLYAESYENGRDFLQAWRPDVLGLDIAYMGYTATYFPYPGTLVPINYVAPPPEGQAAATTTTTK